MFDIKIEQHGKGFRLADETQYYTGLLDYETAATVCDGLELLNHHPLSIRLFIKWAVSEYRRYALRSLYFENMPIAEKSRMVTDAAFNRLAGLRPIVHRGAERWVK